MVIEAVSPGAATLKEGTGKADGGMSGSGFHHLKKLSMQGALLVDGAGSRPTEKLPEREGKGETKSVGPGTARDGEKNMGVRS